MSVRRITKELSSVIDDSGIKLIEIVNDNIMHQRWSIDVDFEDEHVASNTSKLLLFVLLILYVYWIKLGTHLKWFSKFGRSVLDDDRQHLVQEIFIDIIFIWY